MNRLFQLFQKMDVSLKMLAGLLGGNIPIEKESARGSKLTFVTPLRYEERGRVM